MLKEMIQLNFKKDWSSLVTIEPLLWASFVPTIYPDNDTTKRAYSDIYCELTDREQLKKTCYE
jgi:dynein heavy chain